MDTHFNEKPYFIKKNIIRSRPVSIGDTVAKFSGSKF